MNQPLAVTVLLTCGGGPGILAQLESLKRSTRYRARAILADANPASGNLFLPEVDAAYTIPGCQEPDFIPALVRLIGREGIGYLYSGLDEEMPVLAAHRDVLRQAGCELLLPPAQALWDAWDKRATFERLAGKVTLPETVVLNASIDLGGLYAALDGEVLLKAVSSRGGRGIEAPASIDDFEFAARRALRDAGPGGVLVQRLIRGDEYNVTTLHDLDGDLVYAFSRRKFETRLIKSTTTAAVIERNDAVIEASVKAVTAMGLTPGFNNVELIISRDDGLPYLIEINGGRTAAQDMNIVASGVLVTDLMLDILRGEKPQALDHVPDGLASLKIRRDVIVNYADIGGLPAA